MHNTRHRPVAQHYPPGTDTWVYRDGLGAHKAGNLGLELLCGGQRQHGHARSAAITRAASDRMQPAPPPATNNQPQHKHTQPTQPTFTSLSDALAACMRCRSGISTRSPHVRTPERVSAAAVARARPGTDCGGCDAIDEPQAQAPTLTTVPSRWPSYMAMASLGMRGDARRRSRAEMAPRAPAAARDFLKSILAWQAASAARDATTVRTRHTPCGDQH